MKAAAPLASRRRPLLLLTLVCVACLVPFLRKPFDGDDPLFFWAAQQIQAHPLDFYGFRVYWDLSEQPMWEVTKNPPLASYYLALAASLVGWSEAALHLAFLLPTIASAWGIYRIAERCCSRPLLAALTAVLTPAFLVSATSVMCDVLMLAFWVWAIVYWDLGLEQNSLRLGALAGFLMGLCALSKYFGLSLIPLLLVAGCLYRRPGRWLAALIVPIVMVLAYQWWSHALYGTDLVREAAAYASAAQAKSPISAFGRVAVTLAFAGGCVGGIYWFAPLLGSRLLLMVGAVLVPVVAWLVYLSGQIGPFHVVHGGEARWEVILPFAVYTVGGAGLVLLAATDLISHRDRWSVVLFLWTVGTLVFTAFVNWTINGRSILPLVPAAGILIVRRLEQGGWLDRPPWQFGWPLVPAGILALMVAIGDYREAERNWTRAAAVYERIGQPTRADSQSARVWFTGNLGYLYYMKERGAQVLNFQHLHLEPGDFLVLPEDMPSPPRAIAGPFGEVEVPGSWGPTTASGALGAGFYTNRWGPLPFAFGATPPVHYRILRVVPRSKGPR
jgi:4-amino-4-deoxy-L-arabinose transferase-like glycosyltransferase